MNRKYRTILCMAVLVLFVTAGFCWAEDNLEKRVSQLESQLKQMKTDTDAQSPEWMKNITGFNGDLRYRYEWTDDDDATTERNRSVLRGRIALHGKVNDEIDLVLRVTSGNNTLDNSFGADADVDSAYVDYHPGSLKKLPFLGVGVDFIDNVNPFYRMDDMTGLHILAGRFEDPFFHPGNSSLMFDGPDFTGLAGLWQYKLMDDLTVFTAASGSWIREQAADVDTSLWAIQAGTTIDVPGCEGTKFTGGAGYFNYGNIENQTALDSFSGNTSWNDGTNDLYASDYDIVEGFGEVETMLYQCPLRFFGDYANNLRAGSNQDQGYLCGVVVGETAKIGDWRFIYNWRDIEADATVGTYSEGSFGRGTDGKGHKFSLACKVMKNTTFTVDWYMGDRPIFDSNTSSYHDIDYQKVQANLSFKF